MNIKTQMEESACRAAQQYENGVPAGEIVPTEVGEDPPDCHVMREGNIVASIEVTEAISEHRATRASREGTRGGRGVTRRRGWIDRVQESIDRDVPKGCAKGLWIIVVETSDEPNQEKWIAGICSAIEDVRRRLNKFGSGFEAWKRAVHADKVPIWTQEPSLHGKHEGYQVDISRAPNSHDDSIVWYNPAYGASYSDSQVADENGNDITLDVKRLRCIIARKSSRRVQTQSRWVGDSILLVYMPTFSAATVKTGSLATLRVPEALVGQEIPTGGFDRVVVIDEMGGYALYATTGNPQLRSLRTSEQAANSGC